MKISYFLNVSDVPSFAAFPLRQIELDRKHEKKPFYRQQEFDLSMTKHAALFAYIVRMSWVEAKGLA